MWNFVIHYKVFEFFMGLRKKCAWLWVIYIERLDLSHLTLHSHWHCTGCQKKRDVIVGFLYHVINFVWCRELAWSAMDQEMVLLESFYRQALRPWVQAIFYITTLPRWRKSQIKNTSKQLKLKLGLSLTTSIYFNYIISSRTFVFQSLNH